MSSRSSSAVVAVTLAAALVGGAAWLLVGGADENAGAPAAPAPVIPAAPPASVAGAAPATATLPPTEMLPLAAAKTTERQVSYPNGISMPALNGVTTDVKLTWGEGPCTAIVGVVNGPGGWQWYVHENGAHSTTAMVTMNGKPNAMGIVAEPRDPLPVFDPALIPQARGN